MMGKCPTEAKYGLMEWKDQPEEIPNFLTLLTFLGMTMQVSA